MKAKVSEETIVKKVVQLRFSEEEAYILLGILHTSNLSKEEHYFADVLIKALSSYLDEKPREKKHNVVKIKKQPQSGRLAKTYEFFDVHLTVKEWAELIGVDASHVYRSLTTRGKTIEDIVRHRETNKTLPKDFYARMKELCSKQARAC
jgi:hypothetical protein